MRRETTSSIRAAVALLLALACVAQALAAPLPTVAPARVSMAADRLAFIDGAVAESIQKRELPGAVVLVARRGGVVWRKAYGARALGCDQQRRAPRTGRARSERTD